MNSKKTKYPTIEQVENANRIQICRWYRFLPSPANGEEENILAEICARYLELGGMTPEISKKIGA